MDARVSEFPAGRPAAGEDGVTGVTEVTVSVVVPCRGAVAGLLTQQLHALGEQDFTQPWEVLVVDNGMDDAGLAAVSRFRGRLPGLRVVDARAHAGKGYALNRGIEQARSDTLLMLDCDDVVAPDYVRHMAGALAEHDVVGARVDSTSLNPAWLRRRRAPIQEDRLEPLLAGRPVVIGAAMGLRRGAWRAVGGFDQTLPAQEDLDICWRLARAGYRPQFCDRAVVAYRYRTTLRAIWRQEYAYGAAEALLHARHRRHGLAARPLRRTLGGWLEVAAALPRAASRSGRARLATTAGAAVGRLAGSIRHRVRHL